MKLRSLLKNIVDGAGTVFQIMPDTEFRIGTFIVYHSPETTQEAFRRDWEKVGSDLRKAIAEVAEHDKDMCKALVKLVEYEPSVCKTFVKLAEESPQLRKAVAELGVEEELQNALEVCGYLNFRKKHGQKEAAFKE